MIKLLRRSHAAQRQAEPSPGSQNLYAGTFAEEPLSGPGAKRRGNEELEKKNPTPPILPSTTAENMEIIFAQKHELKLADAPAKEHGVRAVGGF
jgi:hypothetical protein